MSCTVLFSAWPRCRAAVTFGGGMTMAYGVPGSVGSAWNERSSSHTRYASDSTAEGSYVLGRSVAMVAVRSAKTESENKTAGGKPAADGKVYGRLLAAESGMGMYSCPWG